MLEITQTSLGHLDESVIHKGTLHVLIALFLIHGVLESGFRWLRMQMIFPVLVNPRWKGDQILYFWCKNSSMTLSNQIYQ